MMRQRIIYPLGDGVAVMTPLDCGLTVEQIARKDVPPGSPYVIIDAKEIPSDRSLRSAWRADFSEPDGYGLTAEEWAAMYPPPPEPPVEPSPSPSPEPWAPMPEPTPSPGDE